LQDFEKLISSRLTFEAIDQEFSEQFTFYLFSLNNSNSTVGGKIKQVKTFMQWAISKGLTANLKFKGFKKPNNRTDIITLNQEQLNSVFTLDLTMNPRLERIRDLFILGCVTGLRFSDLLRLRPVNIKGNYIQIATQKTDTVVRIPINNYSRAILSRYQELPKISNSQMNLYLKEIGRIAGFLEECEITSYKGGHISKITKPLYQLITTHTMRRVFATQSLQRGMQAQDVIRLTGHSSLRTFQAYLHASDQRLESEVAKAWNTIPC
jgi:site-specific recombinase XerD